MNIKETKQNTTLLGQIANSYTKNAKHAIIEAGRQAVDELIKVAKAPILVGNEDDPEPEKLKQAAATKKLAIFDAFEILSRIEEEEKMLQEGDKETTVKPFKGFAEGRSK
jgi:hypothetical protein